MSRGFRCALIGVAMTLLAWYGPWEWPAWPAFTVISLVFRSGDPYQDLPYAGRAAVLTGLIIVNVGFWALVAMILSRLFPRKRTRNVECSMLNV